MKYNTWTNIAASSGIFLLQALLTPDVEGDRIYIPHLRHLIGQRGAEDEDAADSAKNRAILFIGLAITGIVFTATIGALYLCCKFGALKRDNNENVGIIELQQR